MAKRAMSLQQRLVLEFLKKHPGSTSSEMQEALGITYETSKKKVQALVASGHIESNGLRYGAEYRLTGKAFPPSSEYEPNRKWADYKANLRERAVPPDAVMVAIRAMAMLGRATR
jgi:predicted transcriptional regulator